MLRIWLSWLVYEAARRQSGDLMFCRWTFCHKDSTHSDGQSSSCQKYIRS